MDFEPKLVAASSKCAPESAQVPKGDPEQQRGKQQQEQETETETEQEQEQEQEQEPEPEPEPGPKQEQEQKQGQEQESRKRLEQDPVSAVSEPASEPVPELASAPIPVSVADTVPIPPVPEFTSEAEPALRATEDMLESAEAAPDDESAKAGTFSVALKENRKAPSSRATFKQTFGKKPNQLNFDSPRTKEACSRLKQTVETLAVQTFSEWLASRPKFKEDEKEQLYRYRFYKKQKESLLEACIDERRAVVKEQDLALRKKEELRREKKAQEVRVKKHRDLSEHLAKHNAALWDRDIGKTEKYASKERTTKEAFLVKLLNVEDQAQSALQARRMERERRWAKEKRDEKRGFEAWLEKDVELELNHKKHVLAKNEQLKGDTNAKSKQRTMRNTLRTEYLKQIDQVRELRARTLTGKIIGQRRQQQDFDGRKDLLRRRANVQIQDAKAERNFQQDSLDSKTLQQIQGHYHLQSLDKDVLLHGKHNTRALTSAPSPTNKQSKLRPMIGAPMSPPTACTPNAKQKRLMGGTEGTQSLPALPTAARTPESGGGTFMTATEEEPEHEAGELENSAPISALTSEPVPNSRETLVSELEPESAPATELPTAAGKDTAVKEGVIEGVEVHKS
jgi:hypothetical protein